MIDHTIKKNIISVIVSYKPNISHLKKVLHKQSQNFSNIILVNNSPEISLDAFKSSQVTIINNPGNIGLTAALNVGISEAKRQGFKIVALFDQDTELPPNFTQQMLHYINQYSGDKPVAVYSPIFHNHVINETGRHINFKPFRLIRDPVQDTEDYAHPHYVITSGSIIPIKVLDDIGLMREELFIDFVDIEWCLRARRYGYEVLAINKVMINHHLGDYSVSFMGHHYPIHSPLRMYYYFRNAMYLYRLREIDWNWRLIDATRNLFRFLFYMLFVKNRATYFKYIIKGYYHGLIKKMGKLEE
ncbi:MAG: glycosyltransferase family 2 protein [Methylophilaceae bacterium]|nr:glycosyltransferase family 2 protein [Methylophilaceae bacterium]